MDGYSRDRFPTWADKGDNCNAREFVLKRDGTDVEVGNDCYPTSGRWFSVYDEVWVDQPREASIDHMVPLANAWRSGASEWTDDEREVFANDTERGQLIAVTVSSNSAKGDQDPAEWRPGNTEVWCDYVRWWIDVKYDYQLTVTDTEHTALSEMLQSC
ncbi:MAG: HNH endonuclease family protein [Micromonosporaceae bacterium]